MEITSNRWAIVLGSLFLLTAAQASTVTVTATDFSVTYDTSTLGLFGSLNVVGDNLFFTPNNFKASSANGAGVVSTDSTASGIVLTANPGFNFGSLSLSEFGDYQLQGSASTVSVTGQLRAFDYTNPFTTSTTSTIVPNAYYPLTTADGASHDWAAAAQINTGTVPVLGGPTWLSSAKSVDITIENLLTAYTASGTGPQQALIEKKLNGVEVSVAPVPLPSSLGLLASGCIAAWFGTRRRAIKVVKKYV